MVSLAKAESFADIELLVVSLVVTDMTDESSVFVTLPVVELLD